MDINRLEIKLYSDEYESSWDRFVLIDSVNGTFLQTRNFLNYHKKGDFIDNSLLFLLGDQIIAVIPAHIISNDGRNELVSHNGSTFGGIIISKSHYNINYLDLIFKKLDDYVISNHIDKIILKQTSWIYNNNQSELLDYYFYLNNYECQKELGYYIDYDNYNNDIISNFSSSRRRDYKYSLKNNFLFRELVDNEISNFYDVLCNNYQKFNKTPYHSLEQLIEFKEKRLSKNVKFYGVFKNDELIASSMVFVFNNQLFYTQYIATIQSETNTFVDNFLYTKLIEQAKNDGYKYLSFGTSTFNNGKILNRSLAQFKAGFGTSEYVNRTYAKEYK